MEEEEIYCSLCIGNKESAHHLFFRCPFGLQVWKKIRDIIGFPKQTIAIRSTIKWIHRLYKGSRKHDRGVAIALACSVYHIWRFRNLVVHEAVGFNLDGLGYAPLSLYCSICFGPSCASSRLRKQKHWMYAVYPLFRATFVLLFVEMQAYTLGVSVCDQAASISWMIPYLLHYLVLDIGIIRIPVSHQFSPQYNSTALATSRAVKFTPCKLAFLAANARKPSHASSVLSSSGIPKTACFEAAYECGPTPAMALATLLIETIEPFFSGIMTRAACFIPRKTPFKFTSIIFSNSDSSKSRISATGGPARPALFTIMSSVPNLSTATSTERLTSSSSDTSQWTKHTLDSSPRDLQTCLPRSS
nr:LOB domain-containing protein [Ipomoea batatas]